MPKPRAIDANALLEWIGSRMHSGEVLSIEDVITVIQNAPTYEPKQGIGLRHVTAVDYTSQLGDKKIMERTFLYNNTRITQEQALEVLRSGGSSPYIIDMSRVEFMGVFQESGENPPSGGGAQRPKSNTIRAHIHPGLLVDIVLKADQPTGKLTRGRVKDILTNSAQHYRGIKVRLTDGQVGRVQAIIPEADT